MNVYSLYLVLLGVAIVSNTLLIFILFQRQRNIAGVLLTILLMLLNIWFLPKLITNAIHAQGITFELLSRIAALGYIFVPVAFLTFALANGPYKNFLLKYLYWSFALIPTILFLFLSWTTNLIGIHDYHQAHLYFWGYETPTGAWWLYYTIWFDIMVLTGLGILIRNYVLLEDGIKKRQALYVILIASCPFVIGTITLAILPMFDIFVMPVGVILLNMLVITGICILYKFELFVVTPFKVLSSLNYAIITVDKYGSILQMNPYSEKLVRAKASQVLGKNVNQILSLNPSTGKKSNQLKQLLNPVLDKGRSMTFDSYTVVNMKRKAFPSTISITPIYENTEIIGANIFMRDSKKEKERERKKDDFLSMLAHELKTPITSLKMYNQLLFKSNNADVNEQKQISLRMEREINRLVKLIQDSFDLAQLQSGKLRLDREFFGIDDFISHITQTLNVTYPDRRITIASFTNSVVFADKGKIEQVIINLINNAIRFSQASKPIIVHLKADNTSIIIGIQDFGKGITLKYQKKIFEQFFQIDNKLTHKTGLGIGLFIATSIVKAHDGKMWVDSQVGKGSTFYFSLPKST
jgi:PAS domain S-box-containing protein